MKTVWLRQIAVARSGDKGASANVGVIARPRSLDTNSCVMPFPLRKCESFFYALGVQSVTRYEFPISAH